MRDVCEGRGVQAAQRRHLVLGSCGAGDGSYVQGVDSPVLMELSSGFGDGQ